ncbi:MAG: hypothetical protein DRP90_05100 [Planctomycetota bacterium]|nr:MAG: hypothetical protein DRP90_05100 [Planctomycetota bacterium]
MSAPVLRKAVTAVLLAFTAFSVLWIVLKETGAVQRRVPAAPEASVSPTPAPAEGERFAVYYFIGGKRCSTCHKLEEYTREAVEKGFPDLVRSGVLFYETVDCDLPQNQHYIEDYELYAKSVVLVQFEGGRRVRWRKLDGVWERLRDREGFLEWVRSQVRSFMEGK